jgi:glycosyltransferase involved in cell wall biosynthesis
VLIEAMACGVPVVATASPGTREIVAPGVNGLLADAHTPDAVADAIARLLLEPGLRDRLAAGARVSVQQYALPVIAGDYDALFRELAA